MQCDYFDAGRCRSCTLMGVPYAVQLADSQQRCAAALSPVAPDLTWLPPFAGPESGFRNKAKLVVGGVAGAVTLGILDPVGRGVDLRSCGLYEPVMHAMLPRLAQAVDAMRIEPYDVPARRGELKHVVVTLSPDGAAMVRFVLRSQKHLALLRSRLPMLLALVPEALVVSVNLQPAHAAVLEGDTEIVLTEDDTLPMRVGGLTLGLRPAGFFQTNTTVAAALYRQAQQWISDVAPDTVVDLYCGVGGFALHAAVLGDDAPAEIVGVEVSPDAVRSAQETTEALRASRPELRSPTFVVADATDPEVLRSTGAKEGSLVVVNPPRRGIGADLAAALETSGASTVVYSSCNVDSLARDLVLLPSFRAEEARLFDMFPQTNHHEVIVRLHRRSDPHPTVVATESARP